MNTPIMVNADPLPATLAAAIRSIVVLLGPVAVAKGWISDDSLPNLAVMAISVATLCYGVWKTYINRTHMATMADASPNYVAQVK